MDLSEKAKEKLDLLSREVSRKANAVFLLQIKRKPDDPSMATLHEAEHQAAYQAWKVADEAFQAFANECNQGKHNAQAA